jgi:hypothetical protein
LLIFFAFPFASSASKDSSSLSLSLLLCYVTRNPAVVVVCLSFVRDSGVSVVIFFALVYLRLEDLDCLAAAFSPEVSSLHRLGTRLMFSLYLDVKDMRFSLVRAFFFLLFSFGVELFMPSELHV